MLEVISILLSFIMLKLFLFVVLFVVTIIVPVFVSLIALITVDWEGSIEWPQISTIGVLIFIYIWWVSFIWALPGASGFVGNVSKDFMSPFSEYRDKTLEKAPTVTELGTEIRRYKLLSWNPPKHFYVDIQDVETGVVTSNVYVSKHCNKHGELQRMQEYNIVLRKYKTSVEPDKIQYSFTNLYSVFCE